MEPSVVFLPKGDVIPATNEEEFSVVSLQEIKATTSRAIEADLAFDFLNYLINKALKNFKKYRQKPEERYQNKNQQDSICLCCRPSKDKQLN